MNRAAICLFLAITFGSTMAAEGVSHEKRVDELQKQIELKKFELNLVTLEQQIEEAKNGEKGEAKKAPSPPLPMQLNELAGLSKKKESAPAEVDIAADLVVLLVAGDAEALVAQIEHKGVRTQVREGDKIDDLDVISVRPGGITVQKGKVRKVVPLVRGGNRAQASSLQARPAEQQLNPFTR